MKTIHLIFIGVTLLCIFSCTKDKLVPLSSYTMSATENGTLLTFDTYATEQGDSIFGLSGYWINSSSDYNRTCDIEFNNVKVLKGYIGKYSLAVSPSATYTEYQTQPNNQVLFQYNTDATHTGFISITAYDSINRTVSGTFEFTCYGAYNGTYPSTANIVNGVFTKAKLNP